MFRFRSDRRNVASDQAAHIDVVSLANSHVLDHGVPSLEEKPPVLDQALPDRCLSGHELLATDPAHVGSCPAVCPVPRATVRVVPACGPDSRACHAGDIFAWLEAVGFVPEPVATHKIHQLVAADPDLLFGKARMTRDNGIPVVGEQFLWGQLMPTP